MKTKCTTNLKSRRFNSVYQFVIKWSLLYSIGALLVISCTKSDDIETIENEAPIDNQALIIYTDIEPDFVSNNLNAYYELDLNNDGIAEYTFSLWDDAITDYLLMKSPPESNNTMITVVPWYVNALPLNNGSEIFNLNGTRNGEIYEKWAVFTVGNCFGGESGCLYDWKGKDNSYVGLRFIINGKTHFGWARLDVRSSTEWVIKDYAYNAIPDEPILSGQKE